MSPSLLGVSGALDHLVLPCAKLDAAARSYEALGFTVGRRNRHPWGTENHIIQFASAFLELIALAPDYVPLDEANEAFPFAGFLAGQAASRTPSGMVVLRAVDAKADAQRFQREGIGSGRMLDFARSGQAPDGTTRTVAFSLAFADALVAPDLGFFVCQQHYPDNFWNPAMQSHANGATGVADVVLAAAEPAPLAAFMSRFAGQPVSTREEQAVVELPDTTRLTVAPGPGPARLAAIRFAGATGPERREQVGALTLRFGAATDP